MIIGAQAFTLRDFTKTENDIESTLKKIKAMGYNCLQVSAFGDIAPERLRDLAQENKLDIIITHTSADRILYDTQAVINEHKTFNCKNIGIGCMPEKYQGSLEGARAFISDFNEAAKEINKSGLKLHYHNHGFEFQKTNGKTWFDTMVEETSPELWGFIVDLYWVQYGGICPADQLEKMAGRVDVCHFKDMEIVGNKQRTAPIMQGNLNWDKIIDVCNKTGVEYAMIEQDETYGKFPFEELRISYENLKKAGMQF